MAKKKTTTDSEVTAHMEYTFVAKSVHGCGIVNDVGVHPNVHVHLVHPDDDTDRSCMQSPLFAGIEAGSTVTITVASRPPLPPDIPV